MSPSNQPHSFSRVCPQAPRASPEPALSGRQGKAPGPPSRSCPGSKRDPGRDVSLEVSFAAAALKGLRLSLSGRMALWGLREKHGGGHPGRMRGGLLVRWGAGAWPGAAETRWGGRWGPLRNRLSLRAASPSEPHPPPRPLPSLRVSGVTWRNKDCSGERRLGCLQEGVTGTPSWSPGFREHKEQTCGLLGLREEVGL